MVSVLGELIAVLGSRRVVEAALEVLVLEQARDLGDVGRSVLERYATGLGEALGDHLDLAPVAAVDDRVNAAGDTGADEQRAPGPPRHLPGVVESVGPDADRESRRQLDLVDWDVLRRSRSRRQRNGRERRVRQLGRLALLPGWRWLLGQDQRSKRKDDAEGQRERCQGDPPHGEPPLQWSGRSWSTRGGPSPARTIRRGLSVCQAGHPWCSILALWGPTVDDSPSGGVPRARSHGVRVRGGRR